MSVTTKDISERNDRLTVYEAQSSFHELLIQNGIFGNELIKILNIHGEYLEKHFFNVTAQVTETYKVIEHTAPDRERLEEYVKHKICHQLADQIYKNTTVFIDKDKFGMTSRIDLCIMNKKVFRTFEVPIMKEIKI